MNERDELHDIRAELIQIREVLSDINSKLERHKTLGISETEGEE